MFTVMLVNVSESLGNNACLGLTIAVSIRSPLKVWVLGAMFMIVLDVGVAIVPVYFPYPMHGYIRDMKIVFIC